MAGFWDDFWGGLKGMGEDMFRPVNVGPLDEQKRKQIASQGYGFSDRDQMGDLQKRSLLPSDPVRTSQQAINPDRLAGLTSNNPERTTPSYSGSPGRQGNDPTAETPEDPLADLKARRAQLEGMLGEDYVDDGAYNAMIEQAYAGALANIGRARDTAQSNFKESDQNIADLTAGHVNEIKTKDRAAVGANADNLENSYNQTYGNATKDIAADRDAELKAKTAMLQRLGIQEAGIGTAGQVQTEAINNLNQDKAGAMQQANGYEAADLTRNTEQAQSQASAGVERRSALNRDLQNILGKLSDSESGVQSEISQAKLQGARASKNDWLDQQRFNLDSLDQIDNQLQDKTDSDRDYSLRLQELNQKNSPGNTAGVFGAVGNSLSSEGIDPAPYLQTYSQVAAETPYNSQVDGDKSLWAIRQMKKKNPSLDANYIARVVMGIENYGTDKLS